MECGWTAEDDEASNLFAGLVGGFEGEETEEFGIDVVSYPTEVLGIVAELDIVAVHDEQFAFVVLDPSFVLVVESLEVVDTHTGLVVTSAFLDLRNERGYRRADIDEQVRHFDERHHEVEEVAVVLEIAVGHHSLIVEVGREDTCVLVDSTVLNDVLVGLAYFDNILEALVEEIDLQVERPARHILVEISEIGVILYALEAWFPAIMFG